MWVKQILPTSVKELKEAIFICLIIGFTYLAGWLRGHFRVPKNLTFKTRLSAKPLL